MSTTSSPKLPGPMRTLDGKPLDVAPGSPLHVRIPLDARFAGVLIARRLAA